LGDEVTLQPSKIDLTAPDDKLYTPEVGSWVEDKYRLLWCYADLFATSMKGKWDQRVYIDLFAGAGHSRVSETGRYLRGTPLLALSIAHPFDWYVFCDQDSNCISALRKRVEKLRPSAEVRYVPGDVNHITSQLLEEMPPLAPRKKILAFCFADPFRLRDLHFATIRALDKRYMDFMILIPAMDPLRNETTYVDSSSDVVDIFVGTSVWREEWSKKRNAMSFDVFVAEFFSSQMTQLGYTYGGLQDTVLVRSTEKNLPLYRLGFYSRHELGKRFWREARKYSSRQLNLL
jgi:three-Cys-motif partner protein